MLALAACAAGAAGCGAVLPPPYAVVENGGLGPTPASCEDPALRIDGAGVRLVAPSSWPCQGPGASPETTAPRTATYAYWKTPTGAGVVGPAPSNRVRLRLRPLILAGGEQRGLQAGGTERRLAAGQAQRQLAVGQAQQQLAAGQAQQQLAAGQAQQQLAAGQAQQQLAAGQAQQQLAQGGGQRALADGGRVRPVIEIDKAVVEPDVYEDNDGAFAIEVRNIGSATIERLVLLDRVDGQLQVLSAPGSRGYALKDGSRLLVWDDRRPLPPQESRTYPIQFHVPSRAP